MTIKTDNAEAHSISRILSRRKILLGLGGLGLVGAGGGGFALWNYHREHAATYIYTGYREEIYAVAWSPNGKRITCGGLANSHFFPEHPGVIHTWDAFTGEHLAIHNDPSAAGDVKALAWSPNGTRIASAGQEDIISIWDAHSGNILVTHQEPDVNPHVSQRTLAWSPDGTQIVSGGEGFLNHNDPTAQSWDTTTGKPLINYRDPTPDTAPDTLYSVAWSPDGKWIATAGSSFTRFSNLRNLNPTLQIWEASTGKLIFTHRDPHSQGEFVSVTWSPTSKQVAASDSNGLVRIWDIPAQKLILTYSGHAYAVWAVGWSPNSKWIASGSGDETTQIWDPTSGHTAFTYRGHNNAILALAWSPDSAYVATAGGDKTVQVWQANV